PGANTLRALVRRADAKWCERRCSSVRDRLGGRAVRRRMSLVSVALAFRPLALFAGLPSFAIRSSATGAAVRVLQQLGCRSKAQAIELATPVVSAPYRRATAPRIDPRS